MVDVPRALVRRRHGPCADRPAAAWRWRDRSAAPRAWATALWGRAADVECAPTRPPVETPPRACWCRPGAAGRGRAPAAAARNSAGGRSSSCRRSRAAAPAPLCPTGPPTSARRTRLVAFSARSSRRPTSRNRQPWPRVMFSISMPLKAARSVIMRFRCASTSSNWTRPRRRRRSWWSWFRIRHVSIDSRSRTTAAMRRSSVSVRAQARVRVLREEEREHVLFELARRHAARAKRSGSSFRPTSTCSSADSSSGSVVSTIRQARHDAAQEPDAHARRARRSVRARTGCRRRGSAGRCPRAPAASAIPAGASSVTDAHGPVRQHPGVLAAAAALHRHDRHVVRARDARQPAGHHRVRVARGGHVRPEHDRPRLHPVLVPDRRRREGHLLLRDEVVGPRAQLRRERRLARGR